MELKGKVAVITGGVSGLGRGTADLFVQEGAKVALFDLNEELGAKAVQELGAENALFVKVNVASEESVKEGIAAAVAKFGAVHININCAGIGTATKTYSKKGPFPFDEYVRTINVNLVGTFNVMRLCAEQMAKQDAVSEDNERGVVINTASIAAFEGQTGQLAYSASKGGVVAMTLPAARDLASYGIRVMTIAPGIISTPLLNNGLDDKVREALIANVQFPKRLGVPNDYALLARNIVQNAYLNGEVIRIDAGLRMSPR
jgi:3-hydroxyacyl-CoA dehydrogenase / 3-hydroxy-2-methylbutyryl-CoA dehydrogenase